MNSKEAVHVAATIVILISICFVIYVGGSMLVPIAFSIVLAGLLLPVVKRLETKLPKGLSIFLSVLVAISISGLVIYFLSIQMGHFLDDLPSLKEKLGVHLDVAKKWLYSTTRITIRKQEEYLNKTVDKLMDDTPGIVGVTLMSVVNSIGVMMLIPIYTFLILYHRYSFKGFLIGLFRNGSEKVVEETISESVAITQQYVVALLIETAIVFILNTTGFLIIGIDYAIFLALLAAILNLIPYVGMIVANILCMMVTLVSSDSAIQTVWVGVVLAIVQILDNNIGIPLIVGNKVKINAMATIVGVLIGGALCGVAGMFLAIPGLAVTKVILEKSPSLKYWSLLLGEGSRTASPAK